MALLDRVERGKELEEGFVARALAGEAHEGRDGKAEGLHVDVGAVAANELKAFEAPEALGGGGVGESDASTELRYGEARVGGKFSQNFAVNLVNSIVEKHAALLGFVRSGERDEWLTGAQPLIVAGLLTSTIESTVYPPYYRSRSVPFAWATA